MAGSTSRFDGWLSGICAARVLLYANFMTVAACIPRITADWGLSYAEAGSITSGFLFGYSVSLLAFSALADRFGARRMVVISALLSAISAIGFGLFGRSYLSALLLYTLAGATQGGVYTPLIMVFADRYAPAQRGGKIGWLIASTSVGYAGSLAISALMLESGGWQAAFLVTGLLPAAGALLLWLVLRRTPNHIHPRQAGGGFLHVLRTNRPARHLLAGYTGHSWELLGMWSWIPAFLAANAVLASGAAGAGGEKGIMLAGGLHVAGAFAASSMGRLSDHWGRPRVLFLLGVLGTAMSFAIGWLVAWPVAVVGLLGLVYAFVAIGDSPVLSTAITEVVDPSRLGTVLAFRSLLGFGAGAAATAVFGVILDLTAVPGDKSTGWGWAFMALGLGGLLASICARAVRTGYPKRDTGGA